MHPPLRLLLSLLSLLLVTRIPAEEIFRDRGLAGGLNLSAVSSREKPLELGVVLKGEEGVENAWRLAQWGTHFNLIDATPETQADGTRLLQNSAKMVRVLPGGLSGEGVVLGVNAITEYGGVPRKAGEFWPHLLLEQKMPGDFRLSDATALAFNVSFRVGHCTIAPDVVPDPGLHTAHITAYWTLNNRNPDSPDKGDMIWFGLPLFDARHDVPRGHQAVDTAEENGKFICTLEGSRFYDKPTGDGQWHTLTCDLIPLVKEALAASQAKGFLRNTRFEDLYATSFNLGWEVPGPYDCEITLKDLRLVKKGCSSGTTDSRTLAR